MPLLRGDRLHWGIVMRFKLGGAAMTALLLATSAHAAVDAVVTASNASVNLTNIGGFASGVQLAGNLNDLFGAGGSYDATSDVDGPEITFKNGNFAAGGYAAVSSFTSLDVTFTNDSSESFIPSFGSTILPAGLGLFVGSGCGTGPVRDCAEDVNAAVGLTGLPNNFSNESSLIAQSTFDFRILDGETTVYSLSGSVSLIRDFQLGTNFFVTDLADAAGALTNFMQVADRPTAFAFGWDATDISFDLPGIMNPGDTRTLSYQTAVTTFTASPLLQCAGAVAFSAFGDPIGRNGSIPPPAAAERQAFALDTDPGCTMPSRPAPSIVRTFRFATPTFVNGRLTIALLPPFGGTVPEPATWAMMLGGFGLAGSALRRRRRLTAAA